MVAGQIAQPRRVELRPSPPVFHSKFSSFIPPEEVDWWGVDEATPWREDLYTPCPKARSLLNWGQGPPTLRPILVIGRKGFSARIVEDGAELKEDLKKLLVKYDWSWTEMQRNGVIVHGHQDPMAIL